MKLTNRLLGPALCMALLAAPSFADVASPAEKSALSVVVNQFEADFFGGNFEAVANGIPPKIIVLIADRAGMDPTVLKGIVADQMETAMTQVTLDSYSMDKDNAQWDRTEDGRRYALIPTQLQMKLANGQVAQSKTYTLAFEDERQWYLVRIDDLQQVQMLAEAYPDFKGISFPEASVKILK